MFIHHILIVLSPLPDAKSLPSGEKATEQTDCCFLKPICEILNRILGGNYSIIYDHLVLLFLLPTLHPKQG